MITPILIGMHGVFTVSSQPSVGRPLRRSEDLSCIEQAAARSLNLDVSDSTTSTLCCNMLIAWEEAGATCVKLSF
jgi:hypothetical protein